MEEVAITVIGAGVIGLAIAHELSCRYQDIFVIEKNSTFGQETSSRNSEVIHAGIYYPKGSLKERLCIEGRQLLYEFCLQHAIPHKKIGKLIVALNSNELRELEALYKRGRENGVTDLILLSRGEAKKLEPGVSCQAAILSPSTGILDSHGLMKSLESGFLQKKGLIAYHTELIGIDKIKDFFKVTVKSKDEEAYSFLSRVVINAAGLESDKVAAMAGLARDDYKLKFCKGDYFRVHNNKGRFIQRLIYPVPKKDRAGLGIHATLDLNGSLRLGPDDEYVEKIDYTIDASKARIFYESTHTFLPFVELKDISPDTAGIRPKLQGQGEDFRDFIIQDEAKNGLPGLINLIGIESPGLTASLAIAKLVQQLIKTVEK